MMRDERKVTHFQDVKANVAVLVDVWVVARGYKLDGWCGAWVVGGEGE